MKKVIVTVTFHRVLKTWAATLIVFFLVISNAAFTTKNGSEKCPAEKNLIQKNKEQLICIKSPFDTLLPYGALNYRVVPFVKKYIKAEGADLEKMKVWGKRYLDMYDRILISYGLPKELKYLSVIESGLKSRAVSGAGAAGPWQIMRGEATRMGLKINSRVDERTEFKKSTHAAAKILKELYSQFHDWPLVIAAYNCGAGRVRKAIRKSGSKNFWMLNSFLPLETRCHVKRFMGTHFMFEGNGGLTTMTAAEIKTYNLKVAEMQAKQLQDCEEKLVMQVREN